MALKRGAFLAWAQTSRACGAFHFLTLQPTSKVHLMLLSCPSNAGRALCSTPSELKEGLGGSLHHIRATHRLCVCVCSDADGQLASACVATKMENNSNNRVARVCLG